MTFKRQNTTTAVFGCHMHNQAEKNSASELPYKNSAADLNTFQSYFTKIDTAIANKNKHKLIPLKGKEDIIYYW